MSDHHFWLFVTTTIIIVMTPGPAALSAASAGAGSGWKGGFFSAIGIGTANAVYFGLSATGLATILIASHAVFSVIKWVGVAYLVYLGTMALLSRSGGLSITQSEKSAPFRLWTNGFIIELANPKALLYFAALLPQFIDTSRPLLQQFLIMGSVTFAIDMVCYVAYAGLGQFLRKQQLPAWSSNWINRTAGVAILYAGAKMATISARS